MKQKMIEIERKFLLKDNWMDFDTCSIYDAVEIQQGYLTKNEKGSVRVRIERFHQSQPLAYLMSKTKIDGLMSNFETTDVISLDNAERLLNLFCPKIIKKKRALVNFGGKKWEIDIFESGLVLAEVELNSVDEQVEIPDWIKEEVTGNEKYLNCNM